MKIRTITYFCNPRWPLDERVIQAAGQFLDKTKSAYEAAGYEVQTMRLATVPFPKLLGGSRKGSDWQEPSIREVAAAKFLDQTPRLAEELEKLIQQTGISYASLGPALPENLRSYEVIPEAIAATKNIFFSGVMADGRAANSQIHPAAVRACAEVIVKSAPLDPNGFANLRFASLANVKAGSPFFPAAYQKGSRPAFAIATEAAELAVEAFSGSKTLEEGRKAIIAGIEKHGKAMARVAEKIIRISSGRKPGIRFGGIDFSLAPFPDKAQSIGTAFERMGIEKTGLHGSLTAAAILTEAIERANFRRTGFSGLMLPILEDATLAQRASEGTLTVKDVLLYSAVCGTGLDTVPLPGDTPPEKIVPLLMDLCALALRLDKPLTARLMPVPGKKAGEPTAFDFGFFANSKVMALEAAPLLSPLDQSQTFRLTKR
jgi:uncharacterized protein (UPF0210 family)